MKTIKIHTLVVGSGLSSDFFLRGIKQNKKKKILVLTGEGNCRKNIHFDKKKLSITLSSTFGGLSRKWLGTSKIYDEADNLNTNILVKKASEFQKKLIRSIKYLNPKTNLKNEPKNFSEIKSFNSKKFKVYKSLNLKDPYGKTLVAKKHSDVKYLKYWLEGFNYEKGLFKCLCDNNKNKITIESKYLILACGTIDTSYLLLNYFKLKKIFFRNQPYTYGVFFRKNISKIYKNFNYPIYNYEFNSKIKSSGSFGTYSKRISNFLTKKITLPLLNNKKIERLFFNNTIFFNSFINSKYNELSLVKENNKVVIQSKKDNNQLEKLIKKSMSNLLNHLNSKLGRKFFLLKFLIPKIGFDKHYFGIKFHRNKKLKINNNCQLIINKKLFIVDQSAINIDTSNFITFLSMSNSYKVGKFFNKYITN